MKNCKIIFPLPFGSFCLVMRDAARTFYFIFLNRKSELAGTAIRTDIAGLQLHSPNIWLFYSSCHAFCFSNVRFSHAKTWRPFFYFHPSIDCAEKIELLGPKLKIFQISFVIYCVLCRERSPLKIVHKIQNKNEMRNCKLFFSIDQKGNCALHGNGWLWRLTSRSMRTSLYMRTSVREKMLSWVSQSIDFCSCRQTRKEGVVGDGRGYRC